MANGQGEAAAAAQVIAGGSLGGERGLVPTAHYVQRTKGRKEGRQARCATRCTRARRDSPYPTLRTQ